MEIKSIFTKILKWLILLIAGIAMFIIALAIQKIFGLPFYAVLYLYLLFIGVVVFIKVTIFIRQSDNKNQSMAKLNTEITNLNQVNKIAKQ